jgi:hypothetical protein
MLKKFLTYVLPGLVVAGVVVAGDSGLTNSVTQFTTAMDLKSKTIETLDDIITKLDTMNPSTAGSSYVTNYVLVSVSTNSSGTVYAAKKLVTHGSVVYSIGSSVNYTNTLP